MKESVRLSNPYGECTSPYNLWYISRANVSALTTVEASRFLANFTTSSRNERERDAHRNLLASTVVRSEEHTSELQSRSDLVCRLLLEKKKTGSFAQPQSQSKVTVIRPAGEWRASRMRMDTESAWPPAIFRRAKGLERDPRTVLRSRLT